MKVAVIDCKEARRRMIVDFLRSLMVGGSLVEVYSFSWTSEHWEEKNALECDCIFLHVGATDQPDAWGALTTSYTSTCSVCYSGGTEIENLMRKHESDNPKHVWYGPISRGNSALASRVREDFTQFLNVLVSGGGDCSVAIRTLKCKDWLLEGKLDILHAALKGLSVQELMAMEAWELVSAFDLRHGSRFKELAETGDLRALRDYLLPEQDFVEEA